MSTLDSAYLFACGPSPNPIVFLRETPPEDDDEEDEEDEEEEEDERDEEDREDDQDQGDGYSE